jgi:predicted RNA polymerase sigma factor
MVTLSRAVAVAHVHGPLAGLALIGTLVDAGAALGHRIDAVRGHLLGRTADIGAAREAYLRAARGTANAPERRYLQVRAARVAHQRP